MNIFQSYRRSRFFLWINLVGLAIGLAASILLILFIVNELSYDKHFVHNERIVRLLTVSEGEDGTTYYPISLRQAQTDIPAVVPGVEAAVQLLDYGKIDMTVEEEIFRGIKALSADPEFFTVFQLNFIEGNPQTAFEQTNAVVITHSLAKRLFGSSQKAMNYVFPNSGKVVTGVVEDLPYNTHFQFDCLLNLLADTYFLEAATGLEYHTYYLIKENTSLETARNEIEQVYQPLIDIWSKRVGVKGWGETQLLKDVYLRSSKTTWSIGSTGSIKFIWIFSGLAFLILLLAVMNFIHLFITQGEMRMKEIAIRKTNGAQVSNIIIQFFTEVTLIVLLAFVIGILLAVIATPHFATLVKKTIELNQLWNPVFIVSVIILFLLTVTISAAYPAFYLGSFSPLKIFTKQISFSKKRLSSIMVVLQSVISIILLIFILALFKQLSYLQSIPIGYNPDQILVVNYNKEYNAVKQELLKNPAVLAVAGSHHTFGGGVSGQSIASFKNTEKRMPVDEYRVMNGVCELYELELIEGRFFSENDPDSLQFIMLNQSAVKALGGESPVGKMYETNKKAMVIGVVKDFYYNDPINAIAPLMLTKISYPYVLNVRMAESVSRRDAEFLVQEVIRQFDPSFVINPVWSEDIYRAKFGQLKTMITVAMIGSGLSIFITMLGLLALHLYNTMRRAKEIAIRRVNGAEKTSVFVLLSLDVLKWILIAAVVALPIAAYFLINILNNYTNHTDVSLSLFVFPVLIQIIIALLTVSGVTLWALTRNPIEVIKSE